MKKLKIKVFFTIFLILTAFSFLIIGTSSGRDYVEKKNSISRVLENVETPTYDKELDFPFEDRAETTRKIYLDFTVYTIFLDDSGEYLGIINNTNDDDFKEAEIKAIASKIIKNHSEDLHIGNLYVENYSYVFTDDSTLIIVDNTKLNKTLTNKLVTNILLFILCEIIIFIITYFITKWIIVPVKKSFEKQKRFVADASHELKTPLAVMIASSDAYFNDKNDKWVHNIRNESERMIKLVTDLLDLAKTEEEREIIMSENNLSDIILSSILTFESLFYDNKIKLKYDIDPDIKFVCNADLIADLMSILIDNAIKHCSDKGKVIVNLKKENKQIVLEVKNTGLPIKKEDEEKIFERFYKSDSSRNRDTNNYGLGLSIAKNIVEKHSGKITAHSSGGYTTFKVKWNQK